MHRGRGSSYDLSFRILGPANGPPASPVMTQKSKMPAKKGIKPMMIRMVPPIVPHFV